MFYNIKNLCINIILSLLVCLIINCSLDESINNNGTTSGSSNAKLKDIIFTENVIITPEFSSSETNYTLIVYNDIHSFKIIATADDSAAILKLNGINIPNNSKSHLIYVNDINDGETKKLTLEVTSENKENKKDYIFTIEKLAPTPKLELSYKGYKIYNDTQNYPIGTVLINLNNYYLFMIKNSGSLDLQLIGNTIIDLTGDISFSLYQDISDNLLGPGETTSFQILYNPVTEGTHNCSLTINSNDLCNNPYTVSLEGISTSSQSSVTETILDNFNSGVLDQIIWIKDGANYPFVQSSDKYEGNYALEFGNVEYKEESVIKTYIDVLSPATLSFYFKTYTYDSDNKFQFYVNDVLINSWTNSNDWQEYSRSLSIGKYVLKWRYYNGDSYDVGPGYTAWIDNIHFESGAYKISNQKISVILGSEQIQNNESDILIGASQIGFYKDTEFIIENQGCNQLILSGSPIINILNDPDNVFTLKEDADSTINNGQKSNFIITFTPTLEQNYNATIQIESNDEDTPTFTFHIIGICTENLTIIDNFDSGDLNNFPWTIGGDVLPFVQSEFYNNGGYSLEIGNVNYQEESYCQMIINILEPSTLKFYYRVKNGSNSSNKFKFIVDDIDIFSSSYKDWTEYTYDLGVGNHKIKWHYYAGSSSYTGADYSAWIDDVQLVIGSYIIPDQEINIKYKNIDIINNSTDFDLGNVMPGYSRDIYLLVENIGGLPLSLTGNPDKVQLSGDSVFTLKTDISEDSLNGMGKANFIISFSPDSEASYSTIVTIPNDDENEFNYTFTINANGSSSLNFIDDFENGDLSNHPWGIISDYNPIVQDNVRYNSIYSLAFGNLAYQQEQILKTKIEVLESSTLSFYYKTDTHYSSNILEFYINDNLELTKNYSNNWIEYTYTLNPGIYELKWRYYQGSSSYTNTYNAWIDEVQLTSGSYTYSDQEIKVYFKGNEITNGQSDLDLGVISINYSKDFLFTIENNGSKNLELTDSPNRVLLSGDNIFDLTQDADSLITGYHNTQFIISSFTDTQGSYAGSISILNNDSDNSPFTFTFECTVINALVDFDDFESGNLLSYPWVTAGDAVPFVQNIEVYVGAYSLQFGDISNNQESILETTINVLEDSVLSFYYKVSAESCCDYLIFYDGANYVMSAHNSNWTEY
ncbi:MAG: choice-of-anchor D domain-containing protein, partial [Spirochaetes bacterium]|nr:choice-of-anchor D domain-containing protein [Spirochaetota bacterium]